MFYTEYEYFEENITPLSLLNVLGGKETTLVALRVRLSGAI
jgi:hypothetical protein